VPANKTTKKKKKGSKAPEKEQIQVYFLPEQVAALEEDRAKHEAEVHSQMGPGRRLSRSAHSGSVLHRYLQCRAINPSLSYTEFWLLIEQHLKDQPEKKKRR
jgi:hypothetical protein